MMEAKVSPPNALEMAPPELKECMEKSRSIPAAAAYGLRVFVIWATDSGDVPHRGSDSLFPSVIVGIRHPLVMSHPAAVPICMRCSTVRTRHVANHWL